VKKNIRYILIYFYEHNILTFIVPIFLSFYVFNSFWMKYN